MFGVHLGNMVSLSVLVSRHSPGVVVEVGGFMLHVGSGIHSLIIT